MSQRSDAINNSLVKLEAGLAVIEWFLPRLMAAYKLAEFNDLLLPAINDKQLDLLATVMEKLAGEIDNLQENFS